MTQPRQPRPPRPLLAQLCWFIRLRWIAGLGVIAASLLEWTWLRWHGRPAQMLAVGLAILTYNAILWLVLRHPPAPHRRLRIFLLSMAWVQILLDVGSLTLLTLWTDGLRSPLLGLFVLHMVFASLLLPRIMAYGGAALAMLLLVGGLWLSDTWPSQRLDRLEVLGWAGALVVTIYVTNHITRDLRRQRRRLLRQNRRIRAMSIQIQQHQQTMVQHEKMIALGQMAAGVAHEIANPLASMDSLLQLMQRKPERLKPEAVATLREQAQRIGQIVQQMTSFAHPADSQWMQTSINELVEGVLKMLELDGRFDRIAIDAQLGADVGSLYVLPQALRQVLLNLLVNAADAMSGVERPRLTIRTSRDESLCRIEVTDTGEGIEPANLPRLFEPFFTTKPVGKGTGLGLSISYSLIRHHKGRIEVKSKPGEGATFTICLPVPVVAVQTV